MIKSAVILLIISALATGAYLVGSAPSASFTETVPASVNLSSGMGNSNSATKDATSVSNSLSNFTQNGASSTQASSTNPQSGSSTTASTQQTIAPSTPTPGDRCQSPSIAGRSKAMNSNCPVP
jgi:hypothetical protein